MREHDQGGGEEQRALWELDLDTAMRRRWAEGRARYGPEWQGRHPLEEAFEELIDAQIYLALGQAPCAERLALQAITERVARHIRDLSPAARGQWTGATLENWRPRP